MIKLKCDEKCIEEIEFEARDENYDLDNGAWFEEHARERIMDLVADHKSLLEEVKELEYQLKHEREHPDGCPCINCKIG